MSKPLVSVAMVVCNVPRFLGEAIESILNQTFSDFEFIIVDFGSTDNSPSILSKYADKDKRIKFTTIPHCGLAEARNFASFQAQGRYTAIMDADDISLRHRLESQVNFMQEHPNVGVLGGAVEWIDFEGRSLATMYRPCSDVKIRSVLVDECPVWQPTVLMRTEAFSTVGGYRGAFAPSEDYDLWLRIAERFQLANLNQVLLRYRIHPHQVSVRKRRQQTFGGMAARLSASARQNGRPDPLNGVDEITTTLLEALGVSEAAQEQAVAGECLHWLRMMSTIGEEPAVLKAAVEMLRVPNLKFADRRVLSDLRLVLAELYWKQNRFLPSLLATGHAVCTRPAVIARPLKRLFQKFGLVQDAKLSPAVERFLTQGR
jgi:GT2 family glycosyltransferase